MITIATPGRHAAETHKRDQRRGDEQLVGHGVHDLAEGRDALPRARDVAVEPVGERGKREHDRRHNRPVRRVDEQRHHQHGH
jgi:hypothetical protein